MQASLCFSSPEYDITLWSSYVALKSLHPNTASGIIASGIKYVRQESISYVGVCAG